MRFIGVVVVTGTLISTTVCRAAWSTGLSDVVSSIAPVIRIHGKTEHDETTSRRIVQSEAPKIGKTCAIFFCESPTSDHVGHGHFVEVSPPQLGKQFREVHVWFSRKILE